MNEYYETVDRILIRDDAMTPEQGFLGPPVPGYSYSWTADNCKIGFGARTSTRTQPLPITVAAQVAALVAKECITEAKGFLGGLVVLDIPGEPIAGVMGARPVMDASSA